MKYKEVFITWGKWKVVTITQRATTTKANSIKGESEDLGAVCLSQRRRNHLRNSAPEPIHTERADHKALAQRLHVHKGREPEEEMRRFFTRQHNQLKGV